MQDTTLHLIILYASVILDCDSFSDFLFFFYDLDNSIHKTRLLVRYTVKRPYDIYLIFGNFHDYTGVDQEGQAAMAQEQLRGANPRPRSGQWPREATLRLRSGVAAERSNPTSKEQ